MAIGRDMRLSSPDIATAAVRGASDAGADVVDLGQIGTEMLYFAVGEYGYEGGLQVTASHNPAAYNGMKIVRRGAMPVGSDTGLDKIKERALAELPAPADQAGAMSQRDVYAGFHDRVLTFVDASAIRPLRLVLDGCNGMAGPMIGPVLDRLPVTVSAAQLRARRSLPQPRAQPAARGEPAVHHRPGAQRGRRPRHRLGWRRRPLLLHRRHRRVRPRRPHHGADRPDDARPPPGSDHRLRPARVVGGARRRARGGRDGAREPGRTRLHQGPHPQGGRRVRR